MKLISILRAMDEEDTVEVTDENAPINNMLLFRGSVKDCMKQGYFRNGIVTALCAYENTLTIMVNIEYQKKRKGGDEK